MYFLADEDATIHVKFLHEGDFVVPDTGTVTYTLRDHDGSKLLTNQSVTTDSSTTEINITISAAHNAKSGSLEKRTVVIDYEVDSQVFQIVKHYWLIDFLHYTVSAQNVREWLGVNRAELPDEEIDLVRAYFGVKDDLGDDSSKLDTALQATDGKAFHGNMALVFWAVQEKIPTLQMRVAQKESDDQIAWQRLNKLDFNTLWFQARKEYAAALRAIKGDDPSAPTLFTIPDVDDPVVGDAT